MALKTEIFKVGEVDKLDYNRYALELVLTEDSVSPEDNTSQISYTLNLLSGSKHFSSYGLGAEISLGGVVVARRDRYTEPQMSIGQNASLTILAGTTTVPHNADGSLNLSVEFWIETAATDYTPGYMAMTDGTMALTQIPRQSQIRANPAAIGQVSRLAITRHSTGYTHSVKYTFGSCRGYVSAQGEAVAEEAVFPETDVGFLLPESFYDAIPNAASGVCTLEITTYADGAVIGRDATTFTVMTDPDQCAPEITAFSAEDTNPQTLVITKNAKTFIRHCSTVKCQVEAQGQKGAAIKSMLINGKEPLEFTAEADVLELVVTDSRGYTAKASLTLEMLAYVMLTCHAFAKRTTNAADQVLLQVEGKHYSAGFAGAANQLRLACRLPDGSRVEIPYEESGDDYRGQLILEGLSHQNTYELQVEASDDLNQVLETVTVLCAEPVFHWGKEDFTFRVPVHFADGQAALRYGLADYGFDPDEVTDNALLWYWHEDHPEKAGILLTFSPFPGNIAFQIFCKTDGSGLQYRTRWNYTWRNWKALE